MKYFLLLLFAFAFAFPSPVHAIYDPTSVPNNRYGIHIVDTNDMDELPALVGGWGYVTMVLSDSDRNRDHWQRIFDQMRRAHLIPIIRLATHVENGTWVKPDKDRFYEIVQLLNGLNWPTENRYVILYNEPNHAKEWGGTVDPEDYANTFVDFAQQLKAAHEDFFILPAGLDASAIDDEAQFLSRMIAAKPEILTLMDGWTSHSYPNPGFSGSPYAAGRGTLRTFAWEIGFLNTLGLAKSLPVFITETGWMHSEGKVTIPGFLTPQQVGENLLVAAGVWSDPRIVAVTPFLYNYQDIPFDHFSWKKLGSDAFYDHYFSYQNLPKIPGKPRQRDAYSVLSDLLPGKLVAGSTYTLSALLQNDGQGILNEDYTLNYDGILPALEPGERGTLTIQLQTPEVPQFPVSVRLTHNGREIVIQERTIELLPPPSLVIRGTLGWRKTSEAANVSVLVYDKDTLLQKFTGLSMQGGAIRVEKLADIIPGSPYRVVILIPGYLPRQVIGALQAKETMMYPKRFLPFDFSGDGAFTVADVEPMLRTSPVTAFLRFFGP